MGTRLHGALALACVWLVASSPWVAMLRRIPAGAGFLDHAHVVVGFVALLLVLPYAVSIGRDGRWRTYFPWAGEGGRVVARETVALLRGKFPAAEGGGLFAAIEGLLLLAVLIVAATGAGWFLAQGGADAVAWRTVHVIGARVLMGLLVAHVLAVASHVFEFFG
jgi:thiosulfate reductase cytochrome b subunit